MTTVAWPTVEVDEDLRSNTHRYFADAEFRVQHGREVLRRLPIEAPLLRFDRFWIASGFEQVRRLATRPELRMPAADFPAAVRDRHPGFVDFFASSLSFADRPDHARLRRVLTPHLTPAALDLLGPRIREIVAGLLPTDRTEFDLVDVVCRPLPVFVTALMLGVPDVEWAWLLRRSEGLLTVLKGSFPGTEKTRSAELTNGEFDELSEFALGVARGARGGLLGDAISTGLANGGLDETEAVNLVLLLFMTGVDTVTTALANAVHVLLDQPAGLAGIADGTADPALLFGEATRLITPSPFASRTVVADVEVGGETFHRGDAVLLCYGAANLDPVRFPQPDAFRPDRRPAGTLTFGYGTYHCIGSALAGVEANAALTELAARGVTRGESPWAWRRDLTFQGPDVLPVRLEAGR